MVTLSDNWLTEGLIDFEYKKYLVLAYLQQVQESFRRFKLYPPLTEVISHHSYLSQIKNNKDLLRASFPKRLTDANFQKGILTFEESFQDLELIKELEEIVGFSLEEFEKSLAEGKEIFKAVEEQIVIEPIGLSPLEKSSGYLFVSQHPNKYTSVYNYSISLFESSGERYRGLKLAYLYNSQLSFSNTFEQIKVDLIRSNPQLPNPATYLLTSKVHFPKEETLLPVGKRMLIRQLSI